MTDTAYNSDSESSDVKEQQTYAYRSLLTQLSKTLASLQANISSHIDVNATLKSSAIESWCYLLDDLSTVLLPECYVVFHDQTTMDIQRRRLYDMTQAIYYAMAHYAKSGFVFKLAGIKLTNIVKNDSLDSLPILFDSYTTGKGSNAEVAIKLCELASFSTIDTFDYLDTIESTYQLLITEKELFKFLTHIKPLSLKQKLAELQKRRLVAFSIPSSIPSSIEKRLASDFENIDHALALWMLQNHLTHKLATQTKPPNTQTSTLIDRPTIAVEKQAPLPDLIDNPKALSVGLVLLGFGVYGLYAYPRFFILVYFLILIWPVLYLIVSSLNISENYQGYKMASTFGMWLSLPLMLFGVPLIGLTFFVIASHLFLLSAWVRLRCTGLNVSAPSFLQETNAQSKLVLNSVHRGDYQQLTQKFDALQKQKTLTAEAQRHSNTYPLSIECQGNHLAILLSEQPTEHLRQLIASTNTLYENLEYLQATHPYLAAHVDELIKDLTQNTLIRLNELASHFVKEGQVNASAQALFQQQHEMRIDDLISLNRSQVDNLNTTILEKKMAGFSQVGSAEERKFRDTVMELKILLRWLITQQPDEVRATSHQVILDSLESTTLAQMQDIFFDSQTTTEQRQALQHQIEQLLDHFKQQTVYDIKLLSVADHTTDIEALLQLSKSKDVDWQDMTDMDSVSHQSKAQAFIEMNKHYVQQLLTHWN